jgi:biopolymer transport protein ExbB/TolQ/biopolymer transport protein ExbD
MVNFLSQWNWWFWQSPADLFETWRWLNWLSRGIVVLLLLMLTQVILTTASVLAKQLSERRQSRRFVVEANAVLLAGQFKDAIAIALKYKKTYAAAVAGAGLCAFRELARSLTEEEVRDCVERAMQRVSAVTAAEMRVGLIKLKTIAETAPLIGAFGMLWGIIGAFRGGSGSRWSWLMFYMGNCYVALMFVALGLFVAVLSMWAHSWLDERSRAIAREMKDSALNTTECLRAIREWRDSGTDPGSIDARDETGRSMEVAPGRPGIVLIAVFVFEVLFFFFATLVLWISLSTDAGYASALGSSLLAAGAFVLPIWLARHGGAVFAAGQDVSVGPRFYHRSIERRRQARLPLREGLATLPDRTAVFGVPLLAMFVVMALLNSIPGSVGIPVEIASGQLFSPRDRATQPLVLQVQRVPGADPHSYSVLLRVQNKLVAKNQVGEHLRRELAGREDQSVFIQGDRDIPFQKIAEALDLVQESGGTPVLAGSAKTKQAGP